MNKLLLSVYTGQFPTLEGGGPNNIIFKYLDNTTINNLIFDYLSSDAFIQNIGQKTIDQLSSQLSVHKKISHNLSKNSKLYRKIFGSDLYLPYHFWKKQKYFSSFQSRITGYKIIHSHDSISLGMVSNNSATSKKILTVHSKGALSDEIKQMPKNQKLKSYIDDHFKKIEKKNIEQADVITFPSFSAQQYFEQSLGIDMPPEKVKIIYNGVDAQKINSINLDENIFKKYNLDIKPNSKVLLNVAGHSPEKNIDKIIDTVNLLNKKYRKNFYLINIGDNLSSNFKVDVKNMGLENNIFFLGSVPNTDVIKFMKISDIMLMLSKKVIFDLVILEAMASGMCCIVSNIGGNKEIIENNTNGYLVDITDINAIAKKIIDINPDDVRENAVLTANKFSIKKMTEEYSNLYLSLLDE